MYSDLRLTVRQLAKSPGFTAIIVLTLALGIGACSAIFTAINSVLLRPIAYPESDRLVVLQAESPGPDRRRTPLPPADFIDCSQQAGCFEAIAARGPAPATLIGGGDPVNVIVGRVKGPYFQMLRTTPALGRMFDPADEAVGNRRVVVLTHAFWQARFGGRADVVGTSIQLDQEAYTIVGILPADFPVSENEMFAPSHLPEQMWQMRTSSPFEIIARLKSGVSLEQAQAQLDTIAVQLAAAHPATNKGRGIRAVPLLRLKTENVRATFYTFFAAVAFLLLIACANVANLLLVRATARERELSVRAALGASRAQVFRQLLTESLLLAALGGGLGLLVGNWTLDGLLALAPADLPRMQEITLDTRALAFALAVTLLTGVGFGLVPAWHGSRINLVEVLKGSTRTAGERPGRRMLRHGLVAAEIALALVLLVGAGLLIRSFARLNRVDPGFVPEGAIANVVMLTPKKYRTPAERLQFCHAVMERYRSLPGVTSVGASMSVPFAQMNWTTRVQIEGRPVPEAERPAIVHCPVAPGYFTAMGIPLLRGRIFTDEDRGTARVAIISRTFAERYFPGEDAIGKRINQSNDPKNACEIVGIVGDVRYQDFQAESLPQSYEPFTQTMPRSVTFIVRSPSPVSALAPALRRELSAVDSDQASWRIESLAAMVRGTFARQRFAATLVSVFSVVAVVLATIGTYGVMAFAVAQRTGEFGVRLALGAQTGDLRRLVFGDGLKLIASGLVIGGAGALATTRLIGSLLYETSPRDPWVFAAVATLLGSMALLACWLPARRATKCDPMAALRAE